MPTLNKFEDNQWRSVASTDASQITSNSPVLREYLGLENSEVPDTEQVLESLIQDSKTLKGNVSWLALHGGGGSGGSGGGGGNVQADGVIYVNNDVESGSAITKKDSESLTFTVKAGVSGISYEWNYIVQFNNVVIKSGKISTNNTVTIVAANQLLDYQNGRGKLSITCTSGLKNIYWNGTIIQNRLNISAATSSASIDIANLETSFVNITYSSTVLGSYKLSINDKLNYNVNISNITQEYSQQVKVSDIYTQDNIGSNTTTIKIINNETGEFSETSIEVVIVSNSIVISSNTLSKSQTAPTSVIYGSTIPISFTAYLSGGSFFNYTIKIKNEIVASVENARFGNLISQYIPSSSYDYVEGEVIQIAITVTTTNNDPVTANYYIKFAESSTLQVGTPATSYLLADFKAYGDTSYDKTGKWTSTLNEYIYRGDTPSTVVQSIQLNQANILSGIKQSGLLPPYYRLSNKAYGVISNYLIDGATVPFSDLINSRGDLTISICFKADYHTDDARTVLSIGDYIIDGNGDYILNQGIEVSVHQVLVKSSTASVTVPIEDSEIVNLDINYSSSTNTVKLYIDGVITGSANDIDLKTIIGTNLRGNDSIYLGCSRYGNDYFNFADIQFYRIQIYTRALNDYEVLLNFLQNQSYTHFTDQGLPDGTYIAEGFKRNFIEYNTTTGQIDKSYFWDGNGYSVDTDIIVTTPDESGNPVTGISPDIDRYTIPLPILYVDLSAYEVWTWDNFRSNDSSVISNLKEGKAEGAIFNYYDPTGSNNNIIKGACTISIQGTSTLNDIIKNLNFEVNWDSSSATKTVFIPKKNWCPEDMYTLKADIVDSSHSSNASIGKFINEVLANTEESYQWYAPHEEALSKFKSTDSFYTKSSTDNYKPTMKVAVEGFPVFIIARFYTTDINAKDIRGLGIYQFILGRDSVHNLGMKSLQSVKYNGDDIQVNSVPYYQAGCTISEFDTNSNWIEANTTISMPVGVDLANNDLSNTQLTAALWQYNKETLDTQFEVKYGTAKSATDVAGFQTLVQNIAQAPVRVQNYFDTQANGVNSKEYSGGYNAYKTTDGKTWIPTGDRVQQVNNQDALDGLFNSLDVQSAYKYAVVALMFGLVDNFCKNMPFISFNGDTKFKIGFYDMDTACGMTNQGELGVQSYVYMKGLRNNDNDLIEEYYTNASDAVAISGKENKLFLSLESDLVMAKDQNISSNATNSYSNYWIDLRNTLYNKYKGEFDTLADYFVEKFFKPQTEGCGELLFNLTYQTKYLDTGTYSKLHGRRVSQVRKWLKEHIQFLDSMVQFKTANKTLSLGSAETAKTLALTSFDYYTTINTKTNTPLVMTTTNQGGTYKYTSFCPKNENTNIIYGGGTTTSSVSKTISYSDNLLVLGDKSNTFGRSGFQKINTGTLLGFNDLDLSGCTTFSQDNSSPINFLSTFFSNGKSELRSINLSNTSGAKNLSLQLEQFTKLTDVNIYNGCVSSITLPKTPLVSLDVRNSALTNYTLENQALLEEVDVLGCSLLQTLSISNCERIASVNNVSDLTNLNTVAVAGCPKVTNLSISNCANLTSITINLENLETLVISRCPKLTQFTLSGCSNKLQSLVIKDCTSLQQLNFDNAQYLVLNSLGLVNTKITCAQWGTSLNTNYLDLQNMPNLSTVVIQTNDAIKAIQFVNSAEGAITLGTPFTGCTNLERIYGHVRVNCTGCFKNLNKFSIHGSTNTISWKGSSILDGTRVKMPYEIIGCQPSEVTSTNLYTAGAQCTNMEFSQGSEVFFGTNYTIFDVYYTFSNIGSVTDCSYMFSNGVNTTYGRFNDSKGNSPNRYMFAKCSKITSLSHLFYATGGKTIRLYSPTTNSERTAVTVDDGLYSPLTSLKDMNLMWSSYTTAVDRFVLRRKSDQYNIQTMSYFFMNWILDDVYKTNIPNSAIDAFLNLDSFGNLDGFFVNLQNLKDDTAGTTTGIAGLGHNSMFFDYDKTTANENFKIPTTIQSCRNVLDVQYARGTINLALLFANPANVKYIYNSFRVNQSGQGQITCTLNINDNLLSAFTSLRALGYYYDTTSGLSGDSTTGSLTGAGLTKIINSGENFPFNIFDSCANTLIHVCGLFSGATGSFDNLQLPGKLFLKTVNLQNVSACFYNMKIPYTLSSNGFANCPKLTQCQYLFGESSVTGPIPAKLLYHGSEKVTVTRRGTNTQPIKNEDTGEWTVQNVETTTFTYDKPYSKLIDVQGCLSGISNFTAYVNDTISDAQVEVNSEYYPYRYVQNTVGEWVENDAYNNYQYTYKWLYDGVNKPITSKNVDNPDDGFATGGKVVNDGTATYSAPSVKIKDKEGTTQDTMQFCCAPDLLRYCTNNASTHIDYLFYKSGSLEYNPDVSVTTIYGKGLKGRIPPYLLKPVSAVTNISYMFYGCRGLSCYTIEEDNVSYLIPRDFFKYATKVNNLEGAFAGMRFPANINLSVFNNIGSSNTLNLKRIFVNSNFNDGATVAGIFSSFNTSSTAYAFATIEATDTNAIYSIYANQKVTFSNVFKKISDTTYATDMNYSYTFAWYNKDTVTHETSKTLPNNSTTYNYVYTGNTIPT